jgi:hypothetical protein
VIKCLTDLADVSFDLFKVYYKIVNLCADDLDADCICVSVEASAFWMVRNKMAR